MKQVFTFGKNWQHFIKNYLTEAQINEATDSLSKFLLLPDLHDHSFLDIGCGSGLFSLAAQKLGAKRIQSIDVDIDSIECTKTLRKQTNFDENNWQITQCSILDEDLCKHLNTWDIVYSWGVLHHTGNLWQALENTTKLVAPNGLLYIAIYNKIDDFTLYKDGRFGTSKFWQKEKRWYSHLPTFIQNCIDLFIMGILVCGYTLTMRNPIRIIREHNKLRGMSWRIDIKDWLGGYPYEYANIEEIFQFFHKRGFQLENLSEPGGLRNNEFLFRKSSL